ncbi:marine proteobacterial sortase target protein [Alteromonas sediminis]|uniref:Marine proteobacterial sortase target protein n=1 Tax=Alteromonas sediminis TaxID=2259342 RepID=A0A3N5ZAI8_9ALTE|nr:marine proteobacterial sortase target protein [Alteromonas sediminis]RPJ68144.1 marine proteobacterial sortase target protein [Alteromonas sediminis]
MTKRTRVIVVLSLLALAGAFRFGSPLLLSSDAQASHSHLKIDLSYEASTHAPPPKRVSHYHDVEQGSFFVKEAGDSGYLLSPLLHTQVDFTVTGLISRAVVSQEFTNPSSEWVNGVYVFPLPENAAVDHMKMVIGERVIEGIIKPKETAKSLYEEARLSGKKASLVSQSRPNLFTNTVANIGPGESVKVVIEYQQAVHFEDNTFSLTFPTTITTRYLPSQHNTEQQVEVNEHGWAIPQPIYTQPTPTNNKVAINVALNPGFPVASITSRHHPITQTEVRPNQYQIGLEQAMMANADFTLSWQPQDNQHPIAAHFVQKTEQGQYGMIMLMPPTAENRVSAIAKEMIFVVDTSGSMHGESILQAKQALTFAVNKLSSNDTFNIIQFNAHARALWSESQQNSAANRREANTFIASLTADGGSEIRSALELALGRQHENSERLRQVIFITDGAIGNEAELFNYIHNNIKQTRLFTVGIGSAPNSYFMTEAANMGKGTYTFINTQLDVANSMQALFENLAYPILRDINVAFSDPVESYPKNLPDLYKGQPLMISYKTSEPVTSLNATGYLAEDMWQQSLPLQKGAMQSGLDTLWARRKIAQLSRNKYKGMEASEIDQQILEVAMAHHLVSSMTSLVAVDVTPSALGTSTDRRIHNLTPKGQLLGHLPQTATPALLHLLIAISLMGLALCRLFAIKNP